MVVSKGGNERQTSFAWSFVVSDSTQSYERDEINKAAMHTSAT